jgi:hypothetical protein
VRERDNLPALSELAPKRNTIFFAQQRKFRVSESWPRTAENPRRGCRIFPERITFAGAQKV